MGVDIPHLCYEDGLSSVGACRLCVVEVKGARSLVASCAAAVAPGMEVQTHSPDVMEARRTILDLLIANHPLDCLTCEKTGECKLAEYCYEYGIKETSFRGEKLDVVPLYGQPGQRSDQRRSGSDHENW